MQQPLTDNVVVREGVVILHDDEGWWMLPDEEHKDTVVAAVNDGCILRIVRHLICMYVYGFCYF